MEKICVNSDVKIPDTRIWNVAYVAKYASRLLETPASLPTLPWPPDPLLSAGTDTTETRCLLSISDAVKKIGLKHLKSCFVFGKDSMVLEWYPKQQSGSD